MLGKKVRQRVIPTYSQTFFFEDPLISSKKVQKCQDNCTGVCQDCCNIISHPITRSQTCQQKKHKEMLGFPNEQPIKKPYFVHYIPYKASTLRKQNDLRGQLEEGGVAVFFREKISNKCPNHGGKLIPNDCKFNHTCHGGLGMMNEHCKYPNRNFDRILKQNYDFKHDNSRCSDGPTYVFRQKAEKSKK